jgi:hypothetical protein
MKIAYTLNVGDIIGMEFRGCDDNLRETIVRHTNETSTHVSVDTKNAKQQLSAFKQYTDVQFSV